MRLRIIGVFTLLVSGAFVAIGQESSSGSKRMPSEVQTVKYCDLLKKSESYYGKVIRVEAVFTNLISNESIVWEECGKEKPSISVGFTADKFDELEEKIVAKMNFWGVSDARVIVIGRFHGPRSPESEFNYGHMGWSKYRLGITSLEKIERATKPE